MSALAEHTLPRVAAVTVTYESAAVLPDFLESVASQRATELTLYAIDNASTDETVALLDAAPSAIGRVIVRNDENRGFAAATNQGIRLALDAGVDWILLLNNDTQFGPDTVAGLVGLAVEQGVQVLSPVISGVEPPGSLWFGGGSIRRWQGLQPVHDSFLGVAMAETRVTTTPVEATGFAPGCCLLVHREVFERVGLLDESYFVYWEDVDFALRCREAGIRYYVTSRVRMLHKAGSLTGSASRSDFTLYWWTRNWVILVRRHLRGPARIAALAYIQLQLVGAQLYFRDTWHHYRLRLRAFRDGLSDA